MSAIINVSNLSKQYRELKAVNNISFTVNAGDIYGFLGQNGAGKSTTIRMLLTLIEPTAGNIELFGKNLYSHRKEILRQIGAVIEKPDLYKYLTAYENLSLFAKMSGATVTEKKLNDQLEQVGLSKRAHSKVKTFSQGMKQRLGIAIALIHDPQLIILDEPTNGLDPQGIADIRNLILHLSRHQGKTILVSSHLLHEIELIANRMLIIDKGEKVMEGTVAELVDPANTIVHLEVTNAREMMAWLQNSRWKAGLQAQEQNKNVILLRMNKAQVPELTTELVNAGANIMSLQPQNSLESYFLSLTTENRHVDTFTN
ncbi:ABC transporter ATP-binding protein [Niastella populi]|uniref:Bacitracin ABC transporter ATP-binding protein n=1 Tax=Niastella populi TaxID=550983 RepID=A0A1V9ELP9_9BACT|nr:ABC transporter ATP-binding protein [Niastella populi]OQP46795.1 bacitracin ABC transporter ATP-binding protein [Niastella populi]